MSFNELPNVDDNAKASEESVHAARGFFSQKNGFICRDEAPDYGIDLDVELMLQGTEASSWKFPIQIKSSASFKTVLAGNEEAISRPFPTSRLRYLIERAPAYGLIIFYDENEKICYYEFTEKVVQKIMEARESDDWKSQKSVNIHIPKVNRLKAESVAEIHQQFSNRFEAQKLLIQNHGHGYGIPSFTSSVPEHETSQLRPTEILIKHGLLSINEDNIHFLYELLGKVSMHEIVASKDLTFIAGVVYGEMAKCLEADLYLNKAFQKIDQYNEVQAEALKFTRIKVDFLLGRRSREEYLEELKSVTTLTKNKFNTLLLKINLLHYAVIQKIESQVQDKKLESDILELFSIIETEEIDKEEKLTLKIFQAQNLIFYICHELLLWIKQIRIKESLNIYVSQDDRNQLLGKSSTYFQLATQVAVEARSYASQASKKALLAHAEFALSKFYYSKEFTYLLIHIKDDHPNKKKDFQRTIDFADNARRLFLELGLLNEVRLALISMYNTRKISKLQYGIDITVRDETDDSLLNSILHLNQEMGIMTEFVSEIESAHADIVQNPPNYLISQLKDMSDEEINYHANIILEAFQLPRERLVNLIGELKSYRFFESSGDKDMYELLISGSESTPQEDLWAAPSSYIIFNKKTIISSRSSTDLVELAKEFGALRSTQE